MIAQVLYRKGKDRLLRCCINPREVPLILKEYHNDVCGGHFVGHVTTQKALQSRYWWPTMFSNVMFYTKKYDPCQRVSKPMLSKAMPLNPILIQVPFEKWGIDFFGPIKPPKYVTNWAEALSTKRNNVKTIAKFIYENIITQFRCPKELVSDRGTHFINDIIHHLT
jgi:hypothetical protein